MPQPLLALAAPAARQFGGIDWIVLAAYALAILAIGFYYSRRQRTTEEFFVAGRNKRPILAGISIFASMFTLISYLAVPGEWVQNGPVVACFNVLSVPVILLIVGFFLIPGIMKLPITSAYELLEARLGRTGRMLGSGTFAVIRLVWMALILYTTALILVSTIGCDRGWVPTFELGMGLVATATALAGGMDAVMIISVVDFLVLLLGAILTVASITVRVGGLGGWFPHRWEAHWAPEPFFSTDPHVRVTMLGTFVVFAIGQICLAGSDQIAIQRYLTTRDAAAARRAYVNTAISIAGTFALLGVVGASVVGFYTAFPGSLPAGMSVAKNGDICFPYYMSHYLAPGLSGLVVAGMLAGSMSGLCAGVNSVVTVLAKDFVDTTRWGSARSDTSRLRTARILSLCVGVVIVLGSLVIGAVPGNLIEVTNKTVNLFMYALFGLFFLAMFVRFATPFGAVMSVVYGVAAAILVGYWDLIAGGPRLSFQWIAPVSQSVSIASGVLFSLLPTRGRRGAVIAGWAVASLAPLAAAIAWLLR